MGIPIRYDWKFIHCEHHAGRWRDDCLQCANRTELTPEETPQTALKDSGRREDFPTGSRRDTREGKGRFDLFSVIAEDEKAQLLEAGAIKYGERNWEKGQPLSRYLDSAKRHINRLIRGETDENHAAQAAWNLDAFIHTRELIRRGVLPAELDDMPEPIPLHFQGTYVQDRKPVPRTELPLAGVRFYYETSADIYAHHSEDWPDCFRPLPHGHRGANTITIPE